MVTFYDGLLVCTQSPQGLAIAIVLAENGLYKLKRQPSLKEALGNTSVCGKVFEYKQDHVGPLFVCLADNSQGWQVELEMRDIVETLERKHSFLLHLIDNRYVRMLLVV